MFNSNVKLFYFCLALSLCGLFTMPIMATGLSGYWDFNNSISDLSGNDSNGMVVGTTTYDANGRVGEAFDFDGSTSIDCGNKLGLSIADNISVELWFYPEQWVTGYATHPISKWLNASNANYVMYFYGDTSGSSYKKIRFWANAGGTWKAVSPFYLIPTLNTWYHIIWTYSSTDGGKLYINGTQYGSATGSGILATNTANLKIGKFSVNSGFIGLLDEVKIYEKNPDVKTMLDFGAYGFDAEDDTTAFVAAFNTGASEFIIPQGSYKITNLIVPEGVTLKFHPGAILDIEGILKINGKIETEINQVFKGEGTVCGIIKNINIYPQWFGAKGNGQQDDSSAIQKAANLAQYSYGGTLFIPPGQYLFNNNITFRCNIECQGILVKEIEVDETKTTFSYSTFCYTHCLKKLTKIYFLPDTAPISLSPNAFYGTQNDAFKVSPFNAVPLADGSGTIDLQDGGTLNFYSSDFFTSRMNNHGDEYYDKNDYTQLTSSNGNVFPEFCFAYEQDPDANEWSGAEVYQKGDYCKYNGAIYKATWPSGAGTVYESKYKGVVAIGAVQPDGSASIYYNFHYGEDEEDKLLIWRRVSTKVTYLPPQRQLTVNGLTVEIHLKNDDGQSKRINQDLTLSVQRSNMIFNNMIIDCMDSNATVGMLCEVSNCANIILNNCYFSGATNHGLGYNILNSNCANVIYNNCISINCRDAMAGRHGKNITVNGGFYNRIDDHYGKNYVIKNVEMDAMSTYIPGYCTPLANQEEWTFRPSTAFAFAGENISIENCIISNCTGVFSGRDDVGDLAGIISLKNIVINAENDVSLFSHSISNTFDYAHQVKVPEKIIIENISINEPWKLFLRVLGFENNEYGSLYLRNCESIGKISMTGSGTVSFINCGFDGCIFGQSVTQIYEFYHCLFTGNTVGLTRANIGVNTIWESKDNLMPNPGAEEVISKGDFLATGLCPDQASVSDIVPEGWASYNGANGYHYTWGSTDEQSHSGLRSTFLTFNEFSTEPGYVNFALCLGRSDGYTGKNAINAEPRTKYDFSFYLKGDIPLVGTTVMGWNTDEATRGDKQYLQTTFNIHPTEAWTKYEGSFTTLNDTKKFIIILQVKLLSGIMPGQTIYVDNVEIKKQLIPTWESKNNLIPNPGAEEVMSKEDFLVTGLCLDQSSVADIVAEGWASYNGANGYHYTWGSTDEESRSGLRSTFLTFNEFTTEPGYVNFALCLGRSNGYTGENAINAEPRTRYYFSFYLKGDIPLIGTTVMGWNTDEAAQGDKQYLQTKFNIYPTETWTKYEGIFTTLNDTKKIIIILQVKLFSGIMPGQTIYVDEVEIKKLPIPISL